MANFYNNKKAETIRGTQGDDHFHAFGNALGALHIDASTAAFTWTTGIVQGGGTNFTYKRAGSPMAISLDLLRGSGGYDTIHGSASSDILVYNNGVQANGLGAFRSIEAFRLDAGDDFLDLSAHGPGGAAYATGASAFGETGEDTLLGGAGHDILDGGEGNDLLIGNGGLDTLVGGSGDDRLYADHLALTTSVALGIGDTLSGEDGDDFLVGAAGADRLQGGSGKDALYGALGGDNLHGGNEDDRLYGESGDDLLHGEQGDDLLVGGAGDDALWGEDLAIVPQPYSPGADVLRGGAGDDMLIGGGGADTLEGGAGSDRLEGGADQIVDLFVFDRSGLDGTDTIAFEDGFDLIRFVGLGVTRYEAGGTAGSVFGRDVPPAQSPYGGHVALDVVTEAGEHFTIELHGIWPAPVTAADLSASDFVFG
ncbi:calcium-binding protein [Allosphingosinicella deserti]|nr:calcium-binding protein [Sphingomonas deserti]